MGGAFFAFGDGQARTHHLSDVQQQYTRALRRASFQDGSQNSAGNTSGANRCSKRYSCTTELETGNFLRIEDSSRVNFFFINHMPTGSCAHISNLPCNYKCSYGILLNLMIINCFCYRTIPNALYLPSHVLLLGGMSSCQATSLHAGNRPDYTDRSYGPW